MISEMSIFGGSFPQIAILVCKLCRITVDSGIGAPSSVKSVKFSSRRGFVENTSTCIPVWLLSLHSCCHWSIYTLMCGSSFGNSKRSCHGSPMYESLAGSEKIGDPVAVSNLKFVCDVVWAPFPTASW